ncbi:MULTISPECIES: hypothetical protein [unclassified Moorena]|uniref:hypothetical protein n=1 Tax=unclassified Moorena TaxID=2683338 RepID=UPI001400904E|nr:MULTISPECIES: hypothetical protein [unclassified Moorena]NEO14236.1 hypothetical protein [Moorena sp. SIO3E8]NEQ00184.1 hypothetical protein [Moorena sp. SIO3F7]
MGRWGDGEMGRWGDGEIFIKGNYPDMILQSSTYSSAVSGQQSAVSLGRWPRDRVHPSTFKEITFNLQPSNLQPSTI